MGIYLTFTDRRGRLIDLYDEAWDHILQGHDAMLGQEDALRQCLRNPDFQTQSWVPGKQDHWCYYRAGVLGEPLTDFLKVVVKKVPDGTKLGGGIIVTAFPVEALHPREAILWSRDKTPIHLKTSSD